jgi:hypothetical protein
MARQAANLESSQMDCKNKTIRAKPGRTGQELDGGAIPSSRKIESEHSPSRCRIIGENGAWPAGWAGPIDGRFHLFRILAQAIKQSMAGINYEF